MSVHNLNFNHAAVSVPDAEKAVEWYTSVLGLRVILPVSIMKAGRSLELFQRIYGPQVQEIKAATLTAGNGVSFEIFEFVKPEYNGPKQRPEFSPQSYTGGGFYHICFTSAEPEKVLAKALAAGAMQVGQMISPAQNESCFYMQDPWGNIIEILSCSLEQLLLQNTTKAD